MDVFYTKTHCDRCGGSLAGGRIMSIYNRDCICIDCKESEQRRADYKIAQDADMREIRKGNYDFDGIGLSDDE